MALTDVSSSAASRPRVEWLRDRLLPKPTVPASDRWIEERLGDALLADSALALCGIGRHLRTGLWALRPAAESSWWIQMRVENGVVTLDGHVPSFAHKSLAGAIAWWVPGTRDVVNVLGVTPQRGSEVPDDVIERLGLIWKQDPRVDASKLRASRADAVLTLKGTAASDTERDAAELDAWLLNAASEVVNEIEVLGGAAAGG